MGSAGASYDLSSAIALFFKWGQSLLSYNFLPCYPLGAIAQETSLLGSHPGITDV